jgi:hypothetical protein
MKYKGTNIMFHMKSINLKLAKSKVVLKFLEWGSEKA